VLRSLIELFVPPGTFDQPSEQGVSESEIRGAAKWQELIPRGDSCASEGESRTQAGKTLISGPAHFVVFALNSRHQMRQNSARP